VSDDTTFTTTRVINMAATTQTLFNPKAFASVLARECAMFNYLFNLALVTASVVKMCLLTEPSIIVPSLK